MYVYVWESVYCFFLGVFSLCRRDASFCARGWCTGDGWRGEGGTVVGGGW